MSDIQEQHRNNLHAEIVIDGALWVGLTGAEQRIGRALRALWSKVAEAEEKAELTVLLTTDDRVRALNAQFRDKDQATNVLSFPSGDDDYIGDIALGAETVAREAAELEISLEDHVMHLVVHGTLHLLEHDHENEEDAEEMEKLEVSILKDLGIANPYEGRELASLNASAKSQGEL